MIDLIQTIIFWAGTAWLGWVYIGYGFVIDRWPKPQVRIQALPVTELPSVTVLLTVHDAAPVLRTRLDNLLGADYPSDKLDILVASDGSTDATVTIAQSYGEAGAPVRVLDLPRGGKSAAQNIAMQSSTAEIVVMTDADAEFAADCIHQLAGPFADGTVGCTTAHLLMRDGPGAIASAQNLYWRQELKIREAESRLGILAVASGPAMAVRRSLFRPLPVDIGEDCIIPLDIVSQGFRVLHVRTAIATDEMNHDAAGEFRARIRMTARNWNGTWRYPRLLSPWRHVGYAAALWSHKLGRWLGSPILAAMLAAGVCGLARGQWLQPPSIFFVATAGLGIAGILFERRIGPAASVYGFLAANLGFGIGLAKAIGGRKIVAYRPAMLDRSDGPA